MIETAMSFYASSPEFGRAETRSALVDLINALESPANAQRLDQGGIMIHDIIESVKQTIKFPELYFTLFSKTYSPIRFFHRSKC